jgi:hypothetical protein
MLRIPPRELRNQEKQALLRAIGCAMTESFEVAITFPRHLLTVGRAAPLIAYDTIINSFLLPFLQLHQRFGISDIHFIANQIGGLDRQFLGRIKRVFKACFSRSKPVIRLHGGNSDPEGEATDMLCVARLFAWCVQALHNNSNATWIQVVEDAGRHEMDRNSSRLEELR